VTQPTGRCPSRAVLAFPVLAFVVLAFTLGMTMACTAQAPAQRIDGAAALPSYASHRYYEAPTSIAASIRRTTEGMAQPPADEDQKAAFSRPLPH
jgi:hypothetical protein